jgi:hypothetical protein
MAQEHKSFKDFLNGRLGIVVRIDRETEDEDARLEVKLQFDNETISKDFIYLNELSE